MPLFYKDKLTKGKEESASKEGERGQVKYPNLILLLALHRCAPVEPQPHGHVDAGVCQKRASLRSAESMINIWIEIEQ